MYQSCRSGRGKNIECDVLVVDLGASGTASAITAKLLDLNVAVIWQCKPVSIDC